MFTFPREEKCRLLEKGLRARELAFILKVRMPEGGGTAQEGEMEGPSQKGLGIDVLTEINDAEKEKQRRKREKRTNSIIDG